MAKYCFEQSGQIKLTVYLVQHQINKVNWKQKLLLKRGGKVKEPAISTYFFHLSLLLRTKIHSFWSTNLLCTNGCLQEFACVWNTSFLNEKQSLWHWASHWLGVMWTQHLQVILFHVYLIKYGWLSLPVLAKWHSFCLLKPILLLYSIIPHLSLTC